MGLLLAGSLVPTVLRRRLGVLIPARIREQPHADVLEEAAARVAPSGTRATGAGGFAVLGAALGLSCLVLLLRTHPLKLPSLAGIGFQSRTPSTPWARGGAPTVHTSAYDGYTGGKSARFTLLWDAGTRRVTGSYYTTDRPQFCYRLDGENPAEGSLTLREYTGSALTATLRLTKAVRSGRVVWSGTMFNTDGRRIRVRMARLY